MREEQILQSKQSDLPAILQSKGIQLITVNGGSSYKALCPFHDDKNPSFFVNHKDGKWLWNCFACGIGGTTIDFIMRHENMDFKQAVLSLVPGKEQPLSESIQLLDKVTEHYHKHLLNGTGERGRDYLNKRGLLDDDLIKTFKLGFSVNDLRKCFDNDRIVLKDKYGLLKPNYWETFANSVVFPVIDTEGQVTDLYARRIMNYTDRANHCYNKGSHQSIFNLSGVQDQENIILTESIIDALSIYKAGFKNVTALYGTNGLTDKHKEVLSKAKQVVLALDNDTAGGNACKRLSELYPHIEFLKMAYPDGVKDPNELLVNKGEESLQQAINEAIPFRTVKPEVLTHDPLNMFTGGKDHTQAGMQEGHTYAFKGEDLHYQGSGLCYVARYVARVRSLESLRFILTVTGDGKGSHTDRIDLYLSKSRVTFINAVCKTFEVQPMSVEKDLLSMIEIIEQDFIRRTQKKEETKAPAQIDASEEQEAIQFLKSPELIKRILADLDLLGYVGEDNAKLLLYLCATSRKLDKPISVLIRSQSSSGKSFLIKLICGCLPVEDVHRWTSLTKQSLYYMPDDGLKHKFIAIDERDGMEEAEYPIRSLQSDGALSLAVPIKNPSTNKIETQQLTKEGPIAYVDGSTDTRVNPENANRCFEIFLDETESQTLLIQTEQRKAHTLEGLGVKEDKHKTQKRHQNAQRLLKPVKVIIPFVKHLSFPSSWIRTRRDHDRFLSLIICIAFLHQYQREVKTYQGIEYIEATLQDYEWAYHIAKDVLFHTFEELEKPLFDFYRKLTLAVEAQSKEQNVPVNQYWFTRRLVRQWTQLPDYLIKRFMRSLSDLEYFFIKAGPRGSRFAYALARTLNQDKGCIKGLTTPQELKDKMQGQS